MSKYVVDGTDLTGIADAIRTKTGGSSQIAFPTGFVSGITNIPTGTDTSDATAVAGDISYGKTAYANGQKLTGTYRFNYAYPVERTYTTTLDFGSSGATISTSGTKILIDKITLQYKVAVLPTLTSFTVDGVDKTADYEISDIVGFYPEGTWKNKSRITLKKKSGSEKITGSNISISFKYYDVSLFYTAT